MNRANNAPPKALGVKDKKKRKRPRAKQFRHTERHCLMHKHSQQAFLRQAPADTSSNSDRRCEPGIPKTPIVLVCELNIWRWCRITPASDRLERCCEWELRWSCSCLFHWLFNKRPRLCAYRNSGVLPEPVDNIQLR